jgi:hypothetical protein
LHSCALNTPQRAALPAPQEIFFSKGGWVIPARERAMIDAISSGAATYGARAAVRLLLA